jgi:uncharacterized membrane protein
MEKVNNRNEKVVLSVYVLYAISYVIGITCIIGLIIAYVRKNDVDSQWLKDHFRWQINTFWGTLLFVVIGALTFFIMIGWFIIVIGTIWNIYRITKGWLRFNDGVSPYQKGKKND